ncbi:unnamed protein product, partial [Symbiodinium microadriaticum]
MERASVSASLPWEAHLTFFSFMIRVFLGLLASADVYTDVNFIMLAYISGWPLWILAAMVFVTGVLIALYFGAAICHFFIVSKTEKKNQKDTDWQNYVSALLKLLHFEFLIVDIDEDTAWEADLTPFVNAFPSAYMSGSSVLGVRLSMVYIATASWTNGNPEWNHVNGEMVISSGLVVEQDLFEAGGVKQTLWVEGGRNARLQTFRICINCINRLT